MAQKMKKNNLMKNTPIFRVFFVFFVFLKTMLFFAKNFAKNTPEPTLCEAEIEETDAFVDAYFEVSDY